jgi:hypothetical protein
MQHYEKAKSNAKFEHNEEAKSSKSAAGETQAMFQQAIIEDSMRTFRRRNQTIDFD